MRSHMTWSIKGNPALSVWVYMLCSGNMSSKGMLLTPKHNGDGSRFPFQVTFVNKGLYVSMYILRFFDTR